jgi:hypothetical protein
MANINKEMLQAYNRRLKKLTEKGRRPPVRPAACIRRDPMICRPKVHTASDLTREAFLVRTVSPARACSSGRTENVERHGEIRGLQPGESKARAWLAFREKNQ